MASNSGARTRSRTLERERLLFGLLFGLPEQTLSRLHQLTQQLGIDVSLATLKRYSTEFDWQGRLTQLAAESASQQRQRQLRESVSVLERHAQVARALQHAGGSALQQLINNPLRISDLTPAEIVRLLDLGLRTEAKAVHEATDRREVAVGLANLLTEELVAAFVEINADSDAERRARAFAHRLDALIDRYLDIEEENT